MTRGRTTPALVRAAASCLEAAPQHPPEGGIIVGTVAAVARVACYCGPTPATTIFSA